MIAETLEAAGYDAHNLFYPGVSKEEIEVARLDPESVLNLNVEKALRDKLYRAGIRKRSELKDLSSDDLMSIRGFQYSDFSKIVMALE